MWAMGWMMLGMFLFWGGLIFVAVLLVKALFQSGASQKQVHQADSRGEITREQYDQMKSDIAG
jgi:hypothetical protein